MIVVFVVDTSPSMRQPLTDGASSRSTNGGGMSRLDLAKMAVEEVVRGLNKRVTEHNVQMQQQPDTQVSLRNIGLGFSPKDEFLLLSTGRQHTQQSATAACGGGGRLLVGYGDHTHEQTADNPPDQPMPNPSNVDSFQKQLKRLQATEWEPGKPGSSKKPPPFPEDGGGVVGLNTALSAGLQLLSRYRLTYRSTENYGMGRLPSPAVLNPSGGPAMHALQPACLILITDGVCLRAPPAEGGGSMQLQYGNMPLREFYQEPFRWDQRIFCLGVGGRENVSSTQYLHPHVRTLCEVTGGTHMMLRSSATLSQSTDSLLKFIAPPRPRKLPLPDPLRLQLSPSMVTGANGTFVGGGPVCSFQALEPDMDSAQAPQKYRAMLLYVPHEQAQGQTGVSAALADQQAAFQPPTWCVPESFFPSKKLDTLPPRSAQPNLLFSRFPSRLGSKSFEPSMVMKALNRLDQLLIANRKGIAQAAGQKIPPVKLLSRDVYICEWVSTDGKPGKGPIASIGAEFFPVIGVGSARQSLSEGEGNYLNIGILHLPPGSSTLASSLTTGAKVATVTLLPPEPHILLPLLIRAAEAEHRALKKVAASEARDPGGAAASTAGLIKKQALASRNVHLDEHWRNDFRAYLFRLPPYYQNALRRSLRAVLPASAHSMLNTDGTEGALASQCFSKTCLQKIRNAEQVARENNEMLERQEAELRKRGQGSDPSPRTEQQTPQKRWQGDQGASGAKPSAPVIGYGQYDPRSSTETYLAALRNLPAPWRVGGAPSKVKDQKQGSSEAKGTNSSAPIQDEHGRSANSVLGDLPADCLMAYYESRRRWIFGGSGLATRGLYVDGIQNDGSNMQQCGAKGDTMDESLLSLAGVGVSRLNSTTTTKMGDYRERLLWSRAPVVGYGANDCAGVSATTAVDGSPTWSVDDDAMPLAFFNLRSGQFADSVQARVRSRLMVNFGNPYKDKRADSMIPEMYQSQRPPLKKGLGNDDDGGLLSPPGSPPHDSYSATEGEGEAVFAVLPISRIRKSPSHSDAEEKPSPPPPKRAKTEIPKATEMALKDATDPSKPPLGTIIPQGQDAQTKGEKAPTDAVKQPQPPATVSAKAPPPPRPPPKAPSGKQMQPPGVVPTRPKPPPPASKVPPPPKPPAAPSRPPQRGIQRSRSGDKPPTPQAPRPNPPPKPPNQVRSPVPPKPPQPPQPPNQGRAPPPPQQQQSPTPARVPPPQQPQPPNPGRGPPPSQQPKRASMPPPPPQALELERPDKKPAVDLPPGWMTVWSKSQKRWYFFNTKTNKSVWQWPPP